MDCCRIAIRCLPGQTVYGVCQLSYTFKLGPEDLGSNLGSDEVFMLKKVSPAET